jgi:predicted acyltransferase
VHSRAAPAYHPYMRWHALDLFRGATMAAMVIVNNPGDWNHVYAPLLHAPWSGWTPTDLIFPFFLFIVGVALTFADARRLAWSVVLRRAAVLFGLGLFLAGFPRFHVVTWRIPGVLQRISVCYLAGVAVLRLVGSHDPGRELRRVVGVIGVLLLGYWAALTLVPVPAGTAGDLSAEGNLGAWIDRTLLRGHLSQRDWDPEGILSTLPAIATTLLGMMAGRWARDATTSPRRLVQGLALWGLGGMLAGLAWHLVFPINKYLWTSSYVLFTGGVAAASLAACSWWADVSPSPMRRRLSEPLMALGRNAILLFVLSELIAKTLIYVPAPDRFGTLGSWIHEHLFVPLASPKNASLLYALANLMLLWALLWWLHRRRRYLTV